VRRDDMPRSFDGLANAPRASSTAKSSSDKMVFNRAKYRWPESVRPICRVVRCRSRIPRCFSRVLTARDICAVEQSNWSAAALKPPASTTLTNDRMSPRISTLYLPRFPLTLSYPVGYWACNCIGQRHTSGPKSRSTKVSGTFPLQSDSALTARFSLPLATQT
jgi:hypothetical protein